MIEWYESTCRRSVVPESPSMSKNEMPNSGSVTISSVVLSLKEKIIFATVPPRMLIIP